MKRKVNAVGKNTLTVSLPRKWARKYDVKKGDSLNVYEKGSKLEIESNGNLSPGETNLKLNDSFSVQILKASVKQHYRNGARKINIMFSSPALKSETGGEVLLADALENITSELMGMEIVEKTSRKYVLEQMAEGNKKEFDKFLSKIFLLVQDSLKEFVKYIENSPSSRRIDNDVEIMTKYGNYCARLLTVFDFYDSTRTYSLSSMVELHEFLMDIISTSCYKIEKFELKPTQDLAHLTEGLSELYEKFLKLYKKYSQDNLSDLNEQLIKIEAMFNRDDLYAGNNRAIIFELTVVYAVMQNIIGKHLVMESFDEN